MAELKLLEKTPTSRQIRKAYDLWSICYDRVAAPRERGPRLRGLEAAILRGGERVLDAGAGTGIVPLEILARPGRPIQVYAADLSLRMAAKARKRIVSAGHAQANVLAADARALPLPDDFFDVVYSAYMLDLMPVQDITLALAEFRRVLKPGGRMVLVNMSKSDPSGLIWYEQLYRVMPSSWKAYFLGGCRPVVMDELARGTGFRDVKREYVHNLLPSEIVLAWKPRGEAAVGDR